MKNTAVIDFETYWSDDFTLKKLTTEEYIRDPRFKIHMVGVKWNGEPTKVIRDATKLRNLPWHETAVIAQHAHFDVLILRQLGIVPAFIFDVLSMARMLHPNLRSHSLDSLCEHYDLPKKDYEALTNTKNLLTLPADIEARCATYCMGDCDNEWALFKQLVRRVPQAELEVIDMTVRMFTEPMFEFDKARGKLFYDNLIVQKQKTLDDLGVTKEMLGSAATMQRLLADLGVECPMKDGANGPIPALAKTDAGMTALLEHEDDRVQALAAARLGVKSTINETRTARMLSMASRGSMCVYLNYCGASNTSRFSGGDKMNWQNLERISKQGGEIVKGQIRTCITAPYGYEIVGADASQIEARLLDVVAGQDDSVERWRNGDDQYALLASMFYGFEVVKAEHPTQRNFGKVMKLALGYSMGAPRLREVCRQGPMGAPPIIITEQDAARAVDVYRHTHPAVAGRSGLWRQGDEILKDLASRTRNLTWGPVTIDDGYMILPNGVALSYHGLVRTEDNDGWKRPTRRGWSYIYGAKLVENMTQALARVVVTDAMVKIKHRVGMLPKLQAHDEIVYVVKSNYAETAMRTCVRTLRTPPDWLPHAPLDAEGFRGERYMKS